MRPATATLVGALWITAQLAIPLARVSPSSPYPFPGRFAWSMFAGPLVGRCHHALRATRADGGPAPRPASAPLREVLDARAPREFARAVGLFAPYANSDREVADALDDLLGRWASTLPRGARVESELRCSSPGWPAFSRARSFEGGAR